METISGAPSFAERLGVGRPDPFPLVFIEDPDGGVHADIALLGIGFFALPAGILASGFNEELRRRETSRCPNCGHERVG